jgi:hypothetical protein
VVLLGGVELRYEGGAVELARYGEGGVLGGDMLGDADEDEREERTKEEGGSRRLSRRVTVMALKFPTVPSFPHLRVDACLCVFSLVPEG